MSRVASIAFWPLLLVGAAGLIVMVVVPSNVASGFAARARATSGTVIAKEPANHASIRASYEVGGSTYSVVDPYIGPPNADFADTRVGDIVTVFYDPAAPATAVLSDASRRAANEVAFTFLVATVLSLVSVGGLFVAWRFGPLPRWRR